MSVCIWPVCVFVRVYVCVCVHVQCTRVSYSVDVSSPQRVMVWLVFVTSVCFCLTWQFNQFILLVQALVLFSMDALDLISARQVRQYGTSQQGWC